MTPMLAYRANCGVGKLRGKGPGQQNLMRLEDDLLGGVERRSPSGPKVGITLKIRDNRRTAGYRRPKFLGNRAKSLGT